MKKVFLLVVFVSILSIGCSNNDSPSNSNLANLQTVSNTETNQEIVAKPADTPLPVFTDASEALALGDKLFDISDNEKARCAGFVAARIIECRLNNLFFDFIHRGRQFDFDAD